jgi:hypothetical protein
MARKLADLLAECDAAEKAALAAAGMMLRHATPEQRAWFMERTRARIEEVRAENRDWLRKRTEAADDSKPQ